MPHGLVVMWLAIGSEFPGSNPGYSGYLFFLDFWKFSFFHKTQFAFSTEASNYLGKLSKATERSEKATTLTVIRKPSKSVYCHFENSLHEKKRKKEKKKLWLRWGSNPWTTASEFVVLTTTPLGKSLYRIDKTELNIIYSWADSAHGR